LNRILSVPRSRGEQGHLFPYSPGDDRRIALDAPQKAKNAASFLVGMTQSVQRHDSGDVDGAWGSMFMAGFFAHELLLAAGVKVPSHEVIESYRARQDGAAEGGRRSATLDEKQWAEVMQAMRKKTVTGLSAAESSRHISAQLMTGQFFKGENHDVMENTIAKRWSKRGNS